TSSVGASATNQNAIRTAVADVDHGKETATAAASPSAQGANRARSKNDTSGLASTESAMSFILVSDRKRAAAAQGSMRDLAAPASSFVRHSATVINTGRCLRIRRGRAGRRSILQGRKTAQRLDPLATDDLLEPCFVVGKQRPVALLMPQVQDPGRKASVLA